MTVAISFALIGGVILMGFLANLLFRVTKIPSVLLLIAVGVLLGPMTGWLKSDALISIAPLFGTMALLIILFEGGLELDIETVLRQAPRASLLAILVFIISVGSVTILAHYAAGYSLLNSILIASILGASSPAICIPLVSGLSVRKEIKTFLKLESALGDVLLLVTVLLILDVHTSGKQDAFGMIASFVMSIAIAFGVSTIAGILWSRLIGWMGGEPLAYMLTLGFVFLLYFAVEELHGSAAIAVLMFGIMLENMKIIAGRIGKKVPRLFGIDIRAEKFILNQFMKNITQELSFLIRTFFFVYLGLLLDFNALDIRVGILGAAIVGLLLASRWVGVELLRKRAQLSTGETQTVIAMLPRGLATAVMAFLPGQYGLAGVDLFPVYAFVVIVLTNIIMTSGILFGERQLSREVAKVLQPLRDETTAGSELWSNESLSSVSAKLTVGAGQDAQPAADQASFPTGGSGTDRSAPASFSDWMAGVFGIRPQERETRYIEAIRASNITDTPFWIEVLLASVLTALGLVMNQSAIIIGAALIVPFVWPVLAAGLALAVGDVYLLLKLLVKFALVMAVVTFISALCSLLLPYNTMTAEIAARTRPTILDFLVALIAGIAGAGLFSAKKRVLHYLPGALIALTLLPPLSVMGVGLSEGLEANIFQGSALLFTANFFAVILGAALVFAAIGMPRVSEMEFTQVWKMREFSRPVIHFAVKRLGLTHIVGRAGSLRARLIVTLVFLLALLIPLQMAFNQLRLEYRARQAISEVEKMFVLPGHSSIINSVSSIQRDRIEVRIQVATNHLFTAADIESFEQRVSDRTGRMARLDLVQSLGDVGEGKTIRTMLAGQDTGSLGKNQNINGVISDLQISFENKMRAVSLPPSVVLLSASAELARNPKAPAVRLAYLADGPLAEDTLALLVAWLERELDLPPGGVQLTYTAARYSLEVSPRGDLSKAHLSQLGEIHDLLNQYPQLQATINLPARAGERSVAALKKVIEESLSLPENSGRLIIQADSKQASSTSIILHPVSAQDLAETER